MAQTKPDIFSTAQSESEVDKFILDYLQPDEDFSRACGVAVDRLVRYLQTEMPIDVRSVIKGGSLGKGTALRDKSDIDCVVFINYVGDLRSPILAMSGHWLQETIDKIRHCLGNRNPLPEFEVVGKTRHAVKLRYKRGSFTCDVDLLPAIDILSKGSLQEVYDAMEAASPSQREYYSAPLVQLQVDFVKHQETTVKDLIRFVKYWRKECFQESTNIRLPSSYLLELLCIKVWERTGRPSSIDKRQGLKAVMWLLTKPLYLCVEWSKNYKISSYPLHPTIDRQLLVRDPANPFNDLCGGFNESSWGAIGYVKNKTLRNLLCYGLHMHPPWARKYIFGYWETTE